MSWGQAIREYEEEYESIIRALRDANEAARKRTKEERDAMSVDEEELQHSTPCLLFVMLAYIQVLEF